MKKQNSRAWPKPQKGFFYDCISTKLSSLRQTGRFLFSTMGMNYLQNVVAILCDEMTSHCVPFKWDHKGWCTSAWPSFQTHRWRCALIAPSPAPHKTSLACCGTSPAHRPSEKKSKLMSDSSINIAAAAPSNLRSFSGLFHLLPRRLPTFFLGFQWPATGRGPPRQTRAEASEKGCACDWRQIWKPCGLSNRLVGHFSFVVFPIPGLWYSPVTCRASNALRAQRRSSSGSQRLPAGGAVGCGAGARPAPAVVQFIQWLHQVFSPMDEWMKCMRPKWKTAFATWRTSQSNVTGWNVNTGALIAENNQNTQLSRFHLRIRCRWMKLP